MQHILRGYLFMAHPVYVHKKSAVEIADLCQADELRILLVAFLDSVDRSLIVLQVGWSNPVLLLCLVKTYNNYVTLNCSATYKVPHTYAAL